MLVLTFYQRVNSITYTLYKLYNKKFIQQTRGVIELTSAQQMLWQIFNIQHKPTQNFVLERDSKTHIFDYEKIFQHKLLTELQPDIVIHKISVGGDEFNSICRLNELMLDKISSYNHLAPILQPQELTLASFGQQAFVHAKHYACFNNSFHNTLEQPFNMLFHGETAHNKELNFFASSGLIFSEIADKIPDLTDKKHGRGKWIAVYITDVHTTLCAIKNGKSQYCTSSEIWHEIIGFSQAEPIDPSIVTKIQEMDNSSIEQIIRRIGSYNLDNLSHNKYASLSELLADNSIDTQTIRNYYARQISANISKLGTILGGIDGIIFSGAIGQNNAALRTLICDNLEWLGIKLSRKSNLENQPRIHKKNSTIQAFIVPAEAENAMLKQLIERI